MNPQSICRCQCHYGNGDGCTVHVNGSSQRDGYGIGILIHSPLFTGLHIHRNIGCGASGEERSNGTLLQALEDQRVRVLADTPEHDDRVGHKVDKQHGTYQY